MLSDQARAEKSAAAMLAGDSVYSWLNMSLDHIGPGEAKMSMTICQHMLNGHHSCHGGMLFTLADAAFAAACNSFNQVAVAASASIDFLAPALQGDTVTAHANMRSQGGRTGVYDIIVHNQDNKQIALFRGRAYRLGQPLFSENT